MMDLVFAVAILTALGLFWAFGTPKAPPDAPKAPPDASDDSQRLTRELHGLRADVERLLERLREHGRLEERRRGYRDSLRQALSRVRDHHLPGFRMDSAGMCPICKESGIFDLAQALLGRMEFDLPPPPAPPPPPSPKEPAP